MQIQESTQTRHDLEFMARMLGLQPGIDYCGQILAGFVGRPHLPPLELAIVRGSRDPIANERAMLRISRLIAECEDAERTASNFFAEDARAGHLVGTLN